MNPHLEGWCGGWFLLFLISHVTALVGNGSSSSTSNSNPKQLLILGLGRVGLECGLLAEHCFDHVMGTVRSWPPECDMDGIERIPLSTIEQHWCEASHVLWTIPLPKEKDERLEQILTLLQTKNEHLEWIGMVSTTGIYGNHDGNWVTEDSPLLCTSESNADLYRNVEQLFANVGGQIFRCAGIYDSTRSALHTVYKSGTRPKPIDNDDDESITNRIHSYDIAKAILASMKLPINDKRQSRIYNLADDEPANRWVVLNYAADLLESIGIRLDPFIVKTLDTDDTSQRPTKRERRRQSDRKLVSNQRMKVELLNSEDLTYPTYREGLRVILQEDSNAPWWR